MFLKVHKTFLTDNTFICIFLKAKLDSFIIQLSPALRNRFTEIWCPPSNQRQDLIDIIEHNLNSGIHLSNQEDGTSGVGRAIMEFVDWFTNNELGKR